jgi:hypothetical protein
MANVNPPPQLRMPVEFSSNARVRSYLDNINTILFQLWQRTGGGDDAIENQEQTLTSTGSRVSRNAAKINSLELKEFEIVQTTTSLTTQEFQIIICKNTDPIDITLNPEAVENDEVHIKRREGKINVIGSIDGAQNKVINIKNYSMHLVFDGADWSEI